MIFWPPDAGELSWMIDQKRVDSYMDYMGWVMEALCTYSHDYGFPSGVREDETREECEERLCRQMETFDILGGGGSDAREYRTVAEKIRENTNSALTLYNHVRVAGDPSQDVDEFLRSLLECYSYVRMGKARRSTP